MNAQLKATQTHVTNPLIALTHTWQTAAVAEFTGTADASSRLLRRQLAQRVVALTGRVLREQMVEVDTVARRATALVDDVLFRLHDNELVVVRPCAYCGTGLFESEPITTQSDLGYSLSAWEPYHNTCEPADAADDVSW